MQEQTSKESKSKPSEHSAEEEANKFWYQYVPVVHKHRSRKSEHVQPYFIVPQPGEVTNIQYKHMPKEQFVLLHPYPFYPTDQMYVPVPQDVQVPKTYENFYTAIDARESSRYMKYSRSRSPSPCFYHYGDYIPDPYFDYPEIEKYELPGIPATTAKKKSHKPKSLSKLEKLMYSDIPKEKSVRKKKSYYPSCFPEYSTEFENDTKDLQSCNDEKIDKLLKDVSKSNKTLENSEIPSLSEKYFGNIQYNIDEQGESLKKISTTKSGTCMCSLTERIKNLTGLNDKITGIEEIDKKFSDKSTQTIDDSTKTFIEVESKETQTESRIIHRDEKKEGVERASLKTSVGRVLNTANYSDRLKKFGLPQCDREATTSEQEKDVFKKTWPSRY